MRHSVGDILLNFLTLNMSKDESVKASS